MAAKAFILVETTVGKMYEDEENEYITYMFKPVG